MPDLVVMCGLSGSGKSSYAKRLSDTYGHVVVSSDEIRAEICPGGINDQSMNGKVFQIFYDRVKENLKASKNVVADATFITIKERRKLLEAIKGIDCNRTIMIMITQFIKCLKNDFSRERKIPGMVIFKQRNKFQIPFYEEGWDLIDYSLSQGANKMDLPDFLSTMANFDQRNPHHKDSLLIHSTKVAEAFNGKGYDLESALLHDVAKAYTQTMKDGIAHYYNHENVGSYHIMTNYNNHWAKILDICFLVNYHMLPFGWITDKAKKKWKNIFGEEKFKMLMDFNECDKG